MLKTHYAVYGLAVATVLWTGYGTPGAHSAVASHPAPRSTTLDLVNGYDQRLTIVSTHAATHDPEEQDREDNRCVTYVINSRKTLIYTV